MYFSILTVLWLAVVSATTTDYCGDLKCPPGARHVACNNSLENGGWGNECPAERFMVEITPKLQQVILDQHNKYRNQQAMGETPNYEPATRMAALKWCKEFAKFAAINVKRCEMRHDLCRNTAKYAFVGQNLGGVGRSTQFDAPTSDEDEFNYAIREWFEKGHPNGKYGGWMDFIHNYQPMNTSFYTYVDKFTQVIRDEAHKVGCAATRTKEVKDNTTLNYFSIVCNYSRAIIIGLPIYKAGSTASECKTGTNPKYPGLCSEREKYVEPHTD